MVCSLFRFGSCGQRKKIAAAAQAVAQKEGYTAILDKGNEALIRIVLYHQPALDVTDSIIKEFDRQNP